MYDLKLIATAKRVAIDIVQNLGIHKSNCKIEDFLSDAQKVSDFLCAGPQASDLSDPTPKAATEEKI